MTGRTDGSSTVKSDETLFAIIDTLRTEGKLGVTAISDEIDRSKSCVHKHLQSLASHNYVRCDEGSYRLSFEFLTVGGQVRDDDIVCQQARNTVRELADITDQTASFVIREDLEGVFVYIYNDRYGLRETVPLGNRYPIHQNSPGKAILSALPEEDVESIIERSGLPGKTENTITSREPLLNELERVREQGFATSHEELVPGVQSVATAVHVPERGPVGALNLAGPADDLTEQRINEEYADLVMEMAKELGLRIRYTS